MSNNNVLEFRCKDPISDPLTDLLRLGAQDLIGRAVEAELGELLAQYAECRTIEGNAGVIRNGYQPARELQTGIGPVTVRIPNPSSPNLLSKTPVQRQLYFPFDDN